MPNADMKKLLKPKSMESFIKSKIDALPQDAVEGFSLIKVVPDDQTFKSYTKAQSKTVLKVLNERISAFLTYGSCYCQSLEGGFVIVLSKQYIESKLWEIGWHTINKCCQPVTVKGSDIIPGINVGLATYPESGKTYYDLITSLSIAATMSKKSGINTYAVYTTHMNAEKAKEQQQFTELKAGLNKQQFLLYYQPIMDLKDFKAYGVESLLRWRHPLLGIVPPKDFFNEIESTGEIYNLGLWAFEQLLEQRRQWQTLSPGRVEWQKVFFGRKFIYNFNLSTKQLTYPSLAEDIKRVSRRFVDLDLSEICFEISGFTANLTEPVILKNIASLRDFGFLIAIDNFSGVEVPKARLFSSPAQIIKLRGSCFNEKTAIDATHDIASTIIQDAAKTNRKVIAENIENKEMLSRAQNMGITLAQGYYLGRPAPADEVRRVLIKPVFEK